MPDQLETRLRAERDRLDIKQPPLAVITARAGALRRRRRLSQGGVALAVALAIGGGAATTLGGGPHPPDRTPASNPAADPSGVWSAENITINGLPHLPTDLPGRVMDVEFLDADRGFLLSVECQSTMSCTSWVSATVDGGWAWRSQPAPAELGELPADRLPAMMATGGQITLVAKRITASSVDYVRASTADGTAWHTVTSSAPTGAGSAPIPGAARLYLLGGPNSCGRQVAAVTVGDLVLPASQPTGLEVCWAAPVRAGDGSWWVGGRSDNHPALSVSRDGGQSWTNHVFAGTGEARVTMQGRDVFAVLTDDATKSPSRLLGVAASSDGGVTFGDPHPTAGQATIGGDLVPLLDGRLLIVDGVGHWLVSPDRGATWHRLDGLHQTMRLARTQAGYVAYEMSSIYTAYSIDGSTWQKLDAQ